MELGALPQGSGCSTSHMRFGHLESCLQSVDYDLM